MNLNLTIIGQSITFIVFVLICMKYIWPLIIAAMTERQAKIADGLAAADRANKDLELAQEKVMHALRDAKTEAAGILESANKRATQIVEEAKEQAREEGSRIKAATQAEVEQEVNRAKESLRSQVAVLAFTGAEKVLESSVDQSAHKDMIDKLAASL
ncbi:F0F1 ATP synthase subunit B [Gilvimarinus polysaccharolyticus]|uniref:F0F1 ATP synthase subunit B n=1 Tax=Gilvimarinus polysaccharolyticus TaxID=863921 RepID=UPI0006734505|nr:F0F1 ATP synthase subunit B [Gilvimarinus polysaccharolyticus]